MTVQSYPRVSEWKTVELDGATFYVHRYSIAGTPSVVYKTFETTMREFPCDARAHTTIQHHDEHGWLGTVQSRPLPPELEALEPYSEERLRRVTVWQGALRAEALRAIRTAYPFVHEMHDAQVIGDAWHTNELADEAVDRAG